MIKRVILPISFMILVVCLKAQTNSLRLNITSIKSAKHLSGLARVNSYSFNPYDDQMIANQYFYDVSIFYSRILRKYEFGFGIGMILDNRLSENVYYTGVDTMTHSGISYRTKGGSIHFGMGKSVPLSFQRFFFRAMGEIQGRYLVNRTVEIFARGVDGNSTYLGGNTATVELGPQVQIGISAEPGLYYKLLGDLFVGLSVKVLIYWERSDVTETTKDVWYDSNRKVIKKKVTENEVRVTSISNGFWESFSIIYLF